MAQGSIRPLLNSGFLALIIAFGLIREGARAQSKDGFGGDDQIGIGVVDCDRHGLNGECSLVATISRGDLGTGDPHACSVAISVVGTADNDATCPPSCRCTAKVLAQNVTVKMDPALLGRKKGKRAKPVSVDLCQVVGASYPYSFRVDSEGGNGDPVMDRFQKAAEEYIETRFDTSGYTCMVRSEPAGAAPRKPGKKRDESKQGGGKGSRAAPGRRGGITTY